MVVPWSSIIGDIKLRVAQGAHLPLKDALYVPASTVHLISVRTITRDSKVQFTFGDDDDGCWIINPALLYYSPRSSHSYEYLYIKPPQCQN